MAGHGFEQVAQLVGHLDGRSEEQVDLAQHAHLHLDGDGDHGFKPCIAAVRQGDLGGWRDGDDPGARLRLRLAAQAAAGVQAMLALGHGQGQAVACEQHIALVGLVGPAHGGGIGPRHAADLLHKALSQQLQAAGGAGQRTDLVQRRQALVLHGDAGGLLLHLVLQIVVRGLQRMRHQVEAGRELAELIVGIHRQPRAQLALAQPGLGLLQASHGVDHQQIAHGHEGDGRHDGQRHHEQLEQMQRGSPACDLDFDGIHKAIHLLHKGIGLGQVPGTVVGQGADPPGAGLGPAGADAVEPRARLVAPRHKQRARRIARAQQLQAGVELARALLHGLGGFGLQHQHHAQHVHAQAARLVDGRRAAFELPGHPQGESDGSQGHQQASGAHGQELGRKGGPRAHGAV